MAAVYTIGIRLTLLLHTHSTGSRHVRISGCFMVFSPDYTLHTTIARVITVLEGQGLVSYVYAIGIHLRLQCLSPLEEVASTHIVTYTAAVVIQKALDSIMLYVHTYIILLYSASYYLNFHAFSCHARSRVMAVIAQGVIAVYGRRITVTERFGSRGLHQLIDC